MKCRSDLSDAWNYRSVEQASSGQGLSEGDPQEGFESGGSAVRLGKTSNCGGCFSPLGNNSVDDGNDDDDLTLARSL